MEKWKTHVRAKLFERDRVEKDPYIGVFKTFSRLTERLEMNNQIWNDIHIKSSEGSGIIVGNYKLLQLQFKESEQLAEKLSQTVSDLTSTLYVKEAELQYLESQVSRYRREAQTLGKGTATLRATLSECEFTAECQAKELAALRSEQKNLREGLAEAQKEKDELIQRWMEEKRAEAERVNKYNDTQEKWHRLARRLNRHLLKELGKHTGTPVSTSQSGSPETSLTVQGSNNEMDMEGQTANDTPTS